MNSYSSNTKEKGFPGKYTETIDYTMLLEKGQELFNDDDRREEAKNHFEASTSVTEILNFVEEFVKIIEPHTGLRTLLTISSISEEIESVHLLTTPYVTGEGPKKVRVQTAELVNRRLELEIRSDISKKDNKVDIGSRYILTQPSGSIC